jgi:phage shock protein PspC (stress-responsive transcriptional regulator)
MIGGVAGGLGRYFGIDPIIFRIAAVALAFAGGAGLLVYIAAMLLIPEEELGAATAAAPTEPGRDRWLMVLLVFVGLIVAGPILAIPLLIVGVPFLILGAIVLPFLILALFGLGVWWLVSGRTPQGAGGIARASLLGVGVLLLLAVLFVGAGWAAAAGGGAVVAGLVIASGVMLVAGAFVGGARWLILPALAIAFPLALVSAAGIDLDGGVGDRTYHPGTVSDIRDQYELGIGSLKVDLRDVDFGSGDVPLSLDIGMGEAVVLVPENVCVATRAQVGAGEVQVFGHGNSGLDVDVRDTPTAANDNARLVLDADVGLGSLQVRHNELDPFDDFRDGRPRFPSPPGDPLDPDTHNTGCASGAAG